MRNKFFELIEKGVAPFSYKNIASEDISTRDDVCRVYNNIFSIVSDTHMDVADPKLKEQYPDHNWKYVITGSLVGYNNQRWEKFCCDTRTHAGEFSSQVAGFYSPADLFMKAGLAGQKILVNGDVVYGLYDFNEQTEIPEAPGYSMSSQNQLGAEAAERGLRSYMTSESNIPRPISELSVNVRAKDVQECFRHKSNMYEVAEALNDSDSVLGDNWIVFEGAIVGYMRNKVIYL